MSGREMFDCLVCEVEYADEAYSTKLRKSAEGANGIICKRRAAYKNDESRDWSNIEYVQARSTYRSLTHERASPLIPASVMAFACPKCKNCRPFPSSEMLRTALSVNNEHFASTRYLISSGALAMIPATTSSDIRRDMRSN